MICIYIRSLDQARGLLAHGVLVFPSYVSSDFTHTSSGNQCTACVCRWSLSSSKLSCCLSLHLFPFSFPSLTSSCSTSTVSYLCAESHLFVSCLYLFPSSIPCSSLCLSAISTALHCLFILSVLQWCSHILYKHILLEVALKSVHPLQESQYPIRSMPAACVNESLVSFLIGAQ